MPDIYRVNSDLIVGGPGRLVVKDYDGTFPDSIADVMNLAAPYDLMAGWSDLGATVDGITISRSYDSDDFEVDQVIGAVDTDITGWDHTIETSLAENSVENRRLALIGGTIIETAPTLGTATAPTGAVAEGATIINVTAATAFDEGGFLRISEGDNQETKQISRIEGSTIYLSTPLDAAYTVAAAVAPVTELGTKRIGYGTMQNIPIKTYALISQKKDGSLYMAVIRKAKVNGDDKEQTFEKGKRTLPLSLTAYPEDDAPMEENVYYEIEQVL